jgi:hypothetical protein
MKNISIDEQIIRFIETGSFYADYPAEYEDDSRSKKIELKHENEACEEDRFTDFKTAEDISEEINSLKLCNLTGNLIDDVSKDDVIKYASDKFNKDWQ